MSNRIEKVLVPDIGGATDVDIIEVFVKPGDVVALDDSLITLEGEKATMEIPAPFAGTIKTVTVNVGDKISEGAAIVTMEVAGEAQAAPEKPEVSESTSDVPLATALQEIRVPDLGGSAGVEVIEVLVKPGETLAAEAALITVEGDKASMDIPSPFAGQVDAVHVKLGDKVSENDLIVTLKTEASASSASSEPVSDTTSKTVRPEATVTSVEPAKSAAAVYAGPAVRRLARDLDLDLSRIPATGSKGRVTKEDVKRYVKSSASGASGVALPALPAIDFSQFGEIDTRPLSKIQKFSGANLHRNWVSIPHVTQFEEADITEMEAFRQREKGVAAQQGIRLTPLVFIMKAVVASLKAFPEVNASLDPTGEALILKQYYHVGVAVDTPNGLVVPVIRDVDQKTLFELAKELGEISLKARETGLSIAEMQGGCFTISSLGGIGGTAFTPIVNAPEVAILGVSKSAMKPVYDKATHAFVPRLMLPLSLSYDHRVIDGALGARFAVHLAGCLSDIRKLLL